jgi:glycosyltransferase involved in cell wall biosynthesis
LRVKIQQFLFGGTLLSWSLVGHNIGRALMKRGHDVEFVSTDGIIDKFVPIDLKKHVKGEPTGRYDLQVSYTAMHNFPRYLAHGFKNRFGIWNLDGTVLEKGMVKYYQCCHKMLPSSDFSKQVFIDGKIPEDHLVVVPHGINLSDFETEDKYKLKTTKKTKILLNIATPHKRKNLKNTLKAFGKAFNKSDDVCLVVKVSKGNVKDQKFSVDFDNTLSKFKKEFKDHAEIEVIPGFIPSIIDLYNACDIIFMMSHLEQWWLPGIEAMASGKLVVASNWSGQLHYLNNDNSLLIDGKVVRMPRGYQYWNPSPMAKMFEPSIDDAVDKLRYAVENYEGLLQKFGPSMYDTVQRFTWAKVGEQIEGLCG